MSSSFSLLGKRAFLPFFVTQFLGAFNDNVLKQSIILAILFYLASGEDQSLLINLCALVFIVPFFLFSALGGLMGEAMEKSRLIRRLKVMELSAMVLACVGIWTDSLPLLMAALFISGLQSALFGPTKYAILPQHMIKTELVGANAMIEMGTFLAILLGTMLAGFLMADNQYRVWMSLALIGVSLTGLIASWFIPLASPLNDTIKVSWRYNPIKETISTLKVGFRQRISVSRSLLGNSWFWFIGAVYLTQIPALATQVLGGDESLVTLILVVFSVGIGAGSILCERLSAGKVEIGLVPIGSVGLTVFGALLYGHLLAFPTDLGLVTWQVLVNQVHGAAILGNLFMLGLCGGLYIVPLYAILQSRSEPSERSRVIAAANILNALFMVTAALYSIVILSVLGVGVPELLVSVALLNIAVNIYLFKIVPEFVMRFIVWMLTHTIYRVKHRGMDNIPEDGPVLLTCNHVSFMDALLIAGAINRPVRFVMYYKIFNWPVLSFVFRVAGAIPIASRHENPEMFDSAFLRISEMLKAGEVVCIFPEGKITADGEVNEFKPGIRKILDADPVPVIPMALQGMWNSYFSRSPSKGLFKRVWSKITLNIGVANEPDIAPQLLRDQVIELRQGIQ